MEFFISIWIWFSVAYLVYKLLCKIPLFLKGMLQVFVFIVCFPVSLFLVAYHNRKERPKQAVAIYVMYAFIVLSCIVLFTS